MRVKQANAVQLKKDMENKLRNWNERSSFKIRGVGNLSRSDLSMLELYADDIMQYGQVYNFMKPLGSIREVLMAYDLVA